MNWEGVAALVSAFGAIVIAIGLPVVNSLLKRKEKEIEQRFVKIEKDDRKNFERENARMNNVFALIFGYLHKLMFSIDADRISILQPHPLSTKRFISVSFEITHPDRDVVPHKDNFQNEPMSEWSGFVSELGSRDWMFYHSIEEIEDKALYTEAHRRGVKAMVLHKLVNSEGHWIGTLWVEYTHAQPDFEMMKKVEKLMEVKSKLIEAILPEYKTSDEE